MASKNNNDLKITISSGVTLISDLIAALNAHTEALNRATASLVVEEEKVTQPNAGESTVPAPVTADAVSSPITEAPAPVAEGFISQSPAPVAQPTPIVQTQPTAQETPQYPQQAVVPNTTVAYPQAPSTLSPTATPVANPSSMAAPMTSMQGAQLPVNAAGPVPANGAAMPATAPTALSTNATAPMQNATVDPTLNAISVEGARLVEAGKMAQLQALLQKFGVATIVQLRADQLPAFAAEMRTLGANV